MNINITMKHKNLYGDKGREGKTLWHQFSRSSFEIKTSNGYYFTIEWKWWYHEGHPRGMGMS